MSRIKRIILLLLALLYTGPALALEESIPEVWTAPLAVEYALRNNPDSLVASQRILEAQAMLTKSTVGFYPQLDLSGSYAQTNNPMYSFGNILNQGQFSPGIDFNDPGRTDNLNLTAGVQYRFYNGGQDQARKHAAVAGVDVSSAAQDAVRLQLGFDTFRSFQRIVESENIDRARLASLESIRSSLAVARARYEAGDLLRVDLLNLEVQESLALENQIQAQHNLALAKKIFLHLLGLSQTEVKITTADSKSPLRPDQPTPEQRPELQRLKAALIATGAQIDVARGSRLPTIDGFASYRYDKGTVFDGDGTSWLAGVKVDFKLFDGHSAAADISLGKARLGALLAEKRKLELALDLEITQAELSLSQAEQRQQVTEKMVAQATESESLSQAQFREGVILASDLIDSENRLTDARVRHVLASSAVQIATADLRRAAGLPQFHDKSKSNPSMEKHQ